MHFVQCALDQLELHRRRALQGRVGGGGGGECAGKDCNPLTPERIWYLTSPYSITAESNIKVMELIANQRRFSHYWSPSTLLLIKKGRKNYNL